MKPEADPEEPAILDLAGEAASLAARLRGHVELLGEAGVPGLPRVQPQSIDVRPAIPPAAPRSTPVATSTEETRLDVNESRPRVQVRRRTDSSDAYAAATAPPSATPPLVAPPPMVRQSLSEIQADLGECTRCKLHKGRTKLVFGTGNPKAEIVFVGEGPGEDEDKQGEPFVGRAGQLLTRIIEDGMGLARSDVYICNIVKCRPPQNREPERDEIDACLPFLERQITSVAPRVLVALGRPSTSTLLGRAVSITAVRGKWFEYRGVPLMPTFHPAYVLRRYTPEVRRQVWDDMKEVLRKIDREPPAPRR